MKKVIKKPDKISADELPIGYNIGGTFKLYINGVWDNSIDYFHSETKMKENIVVLLVALVVGTVVVGVLHKAQVLPLSSMWMVRSEVLKMRSELDDLKQRVEQLEAAD